VDIRETVKRCLENKPGAWDMLVETYSKTVFNLAYQFAGSYQEAEDLTQDIFLKLYGALPKYDAGRDFTAWLLTLARNHLIDAYRKTKREKTSRDEFDETGLPAGAAADPEAGLDAAAGRKIVWESLSLLSPDVRMAVIFRDIQDRSYEEIAEIMSVPIGTLKSRINRGRVQLARILREKKGGGHGL
jgi:RNA polymerase sigma-70 factor (ECF subfamily)